MRWVRPVLVSLFGVAVGAAACGTSAVGVEDCRSIEQARCQAARGCNFGIDSSSDEDVCQRFARDNCLHGVVVQAPTTGAVTDCVSSINAVGVCATKNKSELGSACTTMRAGTKSTATVCDLIQNPEQISACNFLPKTLKPPPTSTSPPADAGAG